MLIVVIHVDVYAMDCRVDLVVVTRAMTEEWTHSLPPSVQTKDCTKST